MIGTMFEVDDRAIGRSWEGWINGKIICIGGSFGFTIENKKGEARAFTRGEIKPVNRITWRGKEV